MIIKNRYVELFALMKIQTLKHEQFFLFWGAGGGGGGLFAVLYVLLHYISSAYFQIFRQYSKYHV